MRAFEAGLIPHQYWNASLADVIDSISGYELRNIELKRNTREIIYTIYAALTDPAKREPKEHIWPLPGDAIKEKGAKGILARLAQKGIIIDKETGKLIIKNEREHHNTDKN